MNKWYSHYTKANDHVQWSFLYVWMNLIDSIQKLEAFRQDAILAWEEYQLTGLHVSFEEACSIEFR
ncbi:MAG: hypothetical protein COA74_12295 [Gammaproteobacteria bacterium]|nr:MAG: hypothetical protein COA74_12295 [Gammaproteobacteria bacterium]